MEQNKGTRRSFFAGASLLALVSSVALSTKALATTNPLVIQPPVISVKKIANTDAVVWSGSAGPSNCPIYLSYDISGTLTGTGHLNYISINSDTLVGTGDSTLVNALSINHNFGGGSARGGFNGIYVILNQVGATANTDGNYVSGTFVAQGTTNDGGTGSGALSKGELYGVGSNVRLTTGATNWKVLNSAEFDIAVAAGASVDHKRGIIVVQTSTDVTAGLIDDAGVVIANQNGAPGWTTGICFGQDDGYQPVVATGTLIGAKPHNGQSTMGTVLNGIDLSKYTFSGFALWTTGAIRNGSAGYTSYGVDDGLQVPVNYERGYARWNGVSYEIGTEAGGTGTGRGLFIRSASGAITLTDSAGTDFNRLRFGGTSSAFPALNRFGQVLRARLADDSASAAILHNENVIISTAGSTLTTSESANTYTNTGAGSLATFNLPVAVAGQVYTFACNNVNGVRVVANTGAVIFLGAVSTAAAGHIDSIVVGSVVTIVAINSTTWMAKTQTGTWTAT